jgi:hypothetical protein
MITFRCTQKARTLLGLRDRDLSDATEGDLYEWFVDLATIDRHRCLLPASGHRFAKTNSRSVTRSMNDHIWNSRHYFAQEGGLRLADVGGINRLLNRTPMGARSRAAPGHCD